jgi:hypothetical protein
VMPSVTLSRAGIRPPNKPWIGRSLVPRVITRHLG